MLSWVLVTIVFILNSGTVSGVVDGGTGTDGLFTVGDHTLGDIVDFETATIENGTVTWDDAGDKY